MTKDEQTPELKIRLHNLTQNFVRAYWQKYYYQYRGDLYDLAMEFYCEFLTPKARKGKPKENLLDKFDPSITSLEYLVKVSVIRKLIDRSRADFAVIVSIDKLVEEYGDLINQAFDLVTTDIPEELVDDQHFQRRVIKAFSTKDTFSQNVIFSKLFDLDSPLCRFLQPTLSYINDCPVQQITDKTIVLYVPQCHKCINFSVLDGHPKGELKPFVLTSTDYPQFQSGFSRESFENYNNSKYGVID